MTGSSVAHSYLEDAFYLDSGALNAYGLFDDDFGLARLSAAGAFADDHQGDLSDTVAPLDALASGGSVSGSTEADRELDVLAISNPAGESHTLGLSPAASDGFGGETLRLLDEPGPLLAAKNDFGATLNAQPGFAATSSGTYSSEATDAAATQTDAYSPNSQTVTQSAVGSFDIQIRYTGNSAYQSIFDQAAARWEEVITADLPNFNSSRFGAIDDLLIDASVTAIDGRGGVLGQAGPDEFRSTSAGGLPTHGIMEFDSADVAGLAADGSLFGVILHEMGHVLGLGTLWERFGLTAGTYQYDGAAALAEYRILSGNSNARFIPLENDGGPGTAGGHWEEDIFDSELMTGFANGDLEMSRMSIASLRDLGYGVNLNEADPYTLPNAASGLSLQADDYLGMV